MIVNAKEAKLVPGTIRNDIVSIHLLLRLPIRRIVPNVGKVFDRFAGKPYFIHSSTWLSGFSDDPPGRILRPDGSFQLRQTAFVLLQKPQAGPNNLAGIVITPLCDFCLDEILEINPEGYRCRFHNHAVFTQNYQYLTIKQNPGRIYCLGRDRQFGSRLFRYGSSSRERVRRWNNAIDPDGHDRPVHRVIQSCEVWIQKDEMRRSYYVQFRPQRHETTHKNIIIISKSRIIHIRG